MAGAIIQIAAVGVHDRYLTTNPEITFFKVIFRRHTQFAIESVPQEFSSPTRFGGSASCTVPRAGDMLYKMFLRVEVPAISGAKQFAWSKNLGFAMINNVSIEIDGNLIDKQYGEWMHIWAELNSTNKKAIDRMIGNVPDLYEYSKEKNSYVIYVPFNFWFCNNIGCSRPIVPLRDGSVKINIEFNEIQDCSNIGPTEYVIIDEPICPFEIGDIITQKIGDDIAKGVVMGYDYLTKKMYYNSLGEIQFSSKKSRSDEMGDNMSFNPRPINNDFDIDAIDTSDKFSREVSRNSSDIFSNKLFGNNGSFVTCASNSVKCDNHDIYSNIPDKFKSEMYVDFIYLDSDERQKVINSQGDYLIEQVNMNEKSNIQHPSVEMKLDFNNPCKQFVWVSQLDSIRSLDRFNFSTDRGKNLVETSSLTIASKNRFYDLTGNFTNYAQPYQSYNSSPPAGINAYSIALNPADIQPSSTLNLSLVKPAVMKVTLDSIVGKYNRAALRVYSTNYNILRIVMGHCALVF